MLSLMRWIIPFAHCKSAYSRTLKESTEQIVWEIPKWSCSECLRVEKIIGFLFFLQCSIPGPTAMLDHPEQRRINPLRGRATEDNRCYSGAKAAPIRTGENRGVSVWVCHLLCSVKSNIKSLRSCLSGRLSCCCSRKQLIAPSDNIQECKWTAKLYLIQMCKAQM